MLGYAFALLPIYFFVYLPISHMLYGTTPKPSNPEVANSNLNLSSIAGDEALSCPPHGYRTHILSQEPLIIYIENFLNEVESAHLLKIRYCSNLSTQVRIFRIETT
jgi:prolyl 4-hydroxylase